MILDGMWSRRTAAIFVISGLKCLLYSVKYWKCTMKEEEKQVTPRCKEMPLQLYFGGRTPPAIKLLPNVNKAGSCRRYEIREVTPESGKSKSPSGETPPRIRKRPLAPGSAAGRYRQ